MKIGEFLRRIETRIQRLNGYASIIRYWMFMWRFEIQGRRCALERDVRIRGGCRVRLGDRVTFRRGVFVGGAGVLEIGSGTSLNEQVIIAVTARVSIGANCMIAPRAYILDVDHAYEQRDVPMSQQGYASAPVTIEDDVWIGTQAVILKGVRVGKGAIVGANSVVTKDVPPFSIVGGSPARVIKFRPS